MIRYHLRSSAFICGCHFSFPAGAIKKSEPQMHADRSMRSNRRRPNPSIATPEIHLYSTNCARTDTQERTGRWFWSGFIAHCRLFTGREQK